jgi:hypothetical protein
MEFRGERTRDNEASRSSALSKQRTGGLVVRWVTTSRFPPLYVFAFLFALQTVMKPTAVNHHGPCVLPVLFVA